MALKISETFYSILGESTWAGTPAFFIRLSGCNLRCSYCDTAYAYEGGQELEVAHLVQAVQESPAGLVLVTGGEPLLQAEALILLAGLVKAGFTVLLETNGSLPIDAVPADVHRIVDLKCPGSGMSGYNYWKNLEILRPGDEVKFVISGWEDFQWTLEAVAQHALLGRVPVLISPVFGQVAPREAAAWILESRLPLRLQLQLHKYIWGPEVRGV